jgi:predicted transcriptional regulator of viral defense system
VYSSRVRTLVDAVYDWSRFNSLPRGYSWIRRELAKKRVDAAQLIATTLKYGDKGTIRRVGALLEREGIEARLLRKLEKAVPKTSSLIPWIPTLPKRGTVDRRWGVVINGEV